jgi:hypothetical protein
MEMLKAAMRETSGVRRPGAAALDLAYVAAGRLDGFWEIGLNIWDVAAGVLMIQECGGIITDLAGRDGWITLGWSPRRRPFFRQPRRSERSVVVLHQQAATPAGGKMAPSLRVVPRIAPCRVTRRSFGVTKLLSSCLAWRDSGRQRGDQPSVNRP